MELNFSFETRIINVLTVFSKVAIFFSHLKIGRNLGGLFELRLSIIT